MRQLIIVLSQIEKKNRKQAKKMSINRKLLLKCFGLAVVVVYLYNLSVGKTKL